MKKRKNHSPKSSYAWKEDKTIKKDCCYECGSTEDIHYHHIIPESKGGGMTIPLCIICHGKVHDVDFVKMKKLQKEGIERAKQNGVYGETLEEFLLKPKNAEAVKLIDEWYYSLNKISKMVGLNLSTVKKIHKTMLENNLLTEKERCYKYIDEVMQTYSYHLDWEDLEDFEKKYEKDHKYWSNEIYIDKLLEYLAWYENLLYYVYKRFPDIEDGLTYVLKNTIQKKELFKTADDYVSYVVNRVVFEHYYFTKNTKQFSILLWSIYYGEDKYPNFGLYSKENSKKVDDCLKIHIKKRNYEEYLETKKRVMSYYSDDIKKIYNEGFTKNSISNIDPKFYQHFKTIDDLEDELW